MSASDGDDLNFVIEKLAYRLKSGTPLPRDEIEAFSRAVETIIADSRPSVPAAAAITQQQEKGAVVKRTFDKDDLNAPQRTLLSDLAHPMNSADKASLFSADKLLLGRKELGEGVPLTKPGAPALSALKQSGGKLHQPLGNIVTNAWGSDPFAGYSFDGGDDEEGDLVAKEDAPPPRSWGQRKYQEFNTRPTGYFNANDRDDSASSAMFKAQSPSYSSDPLRPEDMADLREEDLGQGVPRTKPGLPATKELLKSGAKVHQKLGRIQTNTWGSSPFQGYDTSKWGDDDSEGDD